jgi:hypothetical protein
MSRCDYLDVLKRGEGTESRRATLAGVNAELEVRPLIDGNDIHWQRSKETSMKVGTCIHTYI